MVLLGLRGELLMAAEVPAKTNLEEDEGAVLAVEGNGIRSEVSGHSSDDVQGHLPLLPPSSCRCLLVGEPTPECTGGP